MRVSKSAIQLSITAITAQQRGPFLRIAAQRLRVTFKLAISYTMRPDSLPPRSVWANSLWLWLGIAILTVSFAVGYREYREVRALNRIKFERAVDSSAATLRISLRMRESVAQAAASAFRPAADGLDGDMEAIDERLFDYIGNVFSMVWAPRIDPSRQAELMPVLVENSGREVSLFGLQRRRLSDAEKNVPLVVIADVNPRTYANRSSIGLALSTMPIPSEALVRARSTGRVAATAPLNLVQLPNEKAVILYAPVRDQGRLSGYIGFSYRVQELVRGVREVGPMTLMRITDTGPGKGGGIVFESDAGASMPSASIRQVQFGGRTWQIAFARPERDVIAVQRGATAGLIAMLLLIAASAIALYLLDRNQRLAQALVARGEAEEKLRIIAGELAHRVKNAYMVALALASQTLGQNDKDGLKSFSGRMRALAKAADSLTDTRQQSASLRSVIDAEIAFPDRFEIDGPELWVPADGVQNFHLMFHELATNAAKHGALADEQGRVRIEWRVDDGMADLVWQEICASPLCELPDRRGFGRNLLETMVPLQLNGAAALEMNMQGLRYHVRFPLTPQTE